MKDNAYLRGLIGILVIVLIVFVGAKTRNVMDQYNYIGAAPHERDTIVVSGTGKITSKPDLVSLSLGVQTDASTVNDAQTQNTSKMNAIIASLKSMSIADADIQTSNYSISPRYDYSNGKQTILGYTVSQNVDVKVRKLDSVGDVLAKAGSLGANQVGGVNFTIDDPTALQAQARQKAIDDAQKKANTLSSQLGLHIVKVVSFSEGSTTPPGPIPYMYAAKAMDAVAAPVAPTIQSGSLDVTSDVSVTYEVR